MTPAPAVPAMPPEAATATPPRRFDALPLDPALLTVLARHDLTNATPIQAATLPDAVSGQDLLGRARTGSGKTLAFGLGLLTRLAGRRAQPRQPLALVLVPTRELAGQVTTALDPYARALDLRTTTVVGGAPMGRQIEALRRGADIVVATPGRLKDLTDRGDCRLDRVEISVLDEADQMADMGFLPQVTDLLTRTAPDGQRMLFSATLDGDVDRLVRRFMRRPVRHCVDPAASVVTTMSHYLLPVEQTDKQLTTARIGARDGRVIMFVQTKHRADRLARQLLNVGVTAAALHGGKTQPQRTRTLERFRNGDVTVMVATDLAARGIHIDDLELVVNVDPPADAKDYLHRAGRTARAGGTGTVVTLVLPEQRRGTDRMLTGAGVGARTAQGGEGELTRITGARAPSGVPVVAPPPQRDRGRRATTGHGAGTGRGAGSGQRAGPRRRGR